MIVDKVQPASVTSYLYYDPRESQTTTVCTLWSQREYIGLLFHSGGDAG